MTQNKDICIIGVGNIYRNDDGVGIVLSRRLKEKMPPEITVLEKSGEGAELIDSWKGAQKVLVLDAVSSHSPPGTIHRFAAHSETLPKGFFHYSTHAFSVAEAIELSRAMGDLPPEIYVYGIEGENFNSGEILSETIKKSAKILEAEILNLIQDQKNA